MVSVSQLRRNVAVGAMVILSLVAMVWMAIRFGDLPIRLFSKPQVQIMIVADKADGLSIGSPIRFRGVEVGRVSRIEFGEARTSVHIFANIRDDAKLPAGVEGEIFTTLLGGSSWINLNPPLEPIVRPGETPKAPPAPPEGAFAAARYIGAGALPPEFVELAKELRQNAEDFRKANIVGRMSLLLDDVAKSAREVGETIASVRDFVKDSKLQDDLKASVANLRAISQEGRALSAKFLAVAESTQQHLDRVAGATTRFVGGVENDVHRLTGSVETRMLQVAKILENIEGSTRAVQAAAEALGKRDGTVGKLLNDPKLYDSLLDASKELQQTLRDLKLLIKKVEQEGFI